MAPKGLGKGSTTFQGSCWKCGVWGHRSFECPNASLIQGIDTAEQEGCQVDSGIQAEACSVEVDPPKKGWHIGCVEKVPLGTRLLTNKWETFRDENDEDEDEEDENDRESLDCPSLVVSSDDEVTGTPTIQDLKGMKLVTKRRTRFERNRQTKKV
eukprot:7471643-Karenia_brevis.AAC.1